MEINPIGPTTIPPTETCQQQDWFVPETIDGRAASPYHYPLSTPFQPIPVMRRCDVVATHVCRDFQRSPAIPNGLSEVYKLDLPRTGDVATSPLSHPPLNTPAQFQLQASVPLFNNVMPTPQLPRIEELEYWSTGEKGRLRQTANLSSADTVTIPIELYEKVLQNVVLANHIDACKSQADSSGGGASGREKVLCQSNSSWIIWVTARQTMELKKMQTLYHDNVLLSNRAGFGWSNAVEWHSVILFFQILYAHRSGSLFFTGPFLLLMAAIAEWVVGNFFGFLVSYACP